MRVNLSLISDMADLSSIRKIQHNMNITNSLEYTYYQHIVTIAYNITRKKYSGK